MKKVFYAIGLPISLVALVFNLCCFPFARIAKALGHKYWNV